MRVRCWTYEFKKISLFALIVGIALIAIASIPSKSVTWESSDNTTQAGVTKNEIRQYLFKQVEEHELQYRDFKFLTEAIRRESNWKVNALNTNKNGTQDKGLAQINDCWKGYAKENGLDYANSWKDNLHLAVHIYKLQGKSAWTSMNKRQ